MTRSGNILSFDEARRCSSVSSNRTKAPSKTASKTPLKASQKFAAEQAELRRSMPQRIVFDETLETVFSNSGRAGSVSRTRRAKPATATPKTTRNSAQNNPGKQASTSRKTAANSGKTKRENAHFNPSNTRMRTQSSQLATEEAEFLRNQAFLEKEGVEAAESPENAGRRKDKKKKTLMQRFRSFKAERQFNARHGGEKAGSSKSGSSAGASAEGKGGSRAALYEMKMGKNHKRSARMQNPAAGKKRNGLGGFNPFAKLISALDPRSPGFSSVALITCATMLLGVVMLYQPLSSYYQEVRSQQQLQAEYEVVQDYYNNLKSEVEYLSTDQGRVEYVHQELGWVKPGEQVATVEGLTPRDATSKNASITADLSSAVPTPATWYSPVLDVVLGYNKA